jgi:hypothetical protein
MPAGHLTPATIFANAATVEKLIIIILLASVVAAVAVAVLKLKDGQRLSGGSAFLSGLRLGGPVLGGLGACWSLLSISIGLANIPNDVPLRVLAPGFAETVLMIGLGFLAGTVAVLANWAVEARIDRSVLRA